MLKALATAWNSFWFAPQSPTPVALYRIVLGLLALQEVTIHLSHDWQVYYGQHGLIPVQSIVAHWWMLDPQFDLMLLLPQTDSWRMAFFSFYSVALALMILGLFTRVSTIVVFFCLLSIDRHFPFNLNGGDCFMRIAMFLLCFSSAGDAFSLDNVIRGWKTDWRTAGFAHKPSSPWAQRLIQIQLAVAYFVTECWKLSGRPWQDGSAVYYATRMEEFIKFHMPFFLDNKFCIRILTWFTLVIEGALPTLIWFKRFRYWVIAGGILLHIGIDYCINLPIFEWVFMATYITYFYPEDMALSWDWIKSAMRRHLGHPALLAYNGSCPLSVKLAGAVHRFDILDRLELVDLQESPCPAIAAALRDSSGEPLLIISEHGRALSGPSALQRITRNCPMLWPLFLILSFPGSKTLFAWMHQIAGKGSLFLPRVSG